MTVYPGNPSAGFSIKPLQKPFLYVGAAIYCARSLSYHGVTRHGVSNLGFPYSHGAATRHDGLSTNHDSSQWWVSVKIPMSLIHHFIYYILKFGFIKKIRVLYPISQKFDIALAPLNR